MFDAKIGCFSAKVRHNRVFRVPSAFSLNSFSLTTWGRAPALRKPLQVQAFAVEIIIGTSMKGGKRDG
ncbi:MAG: hypothetical protein KJ550_13655 [Proteobacteria bacterium]|nr:hypothetical protein [Desulfobacteraceae bacterium]MBU4014491.1 hypothetical protein [Pseudomonadota bacterium]MBU4068493.1 hypothetical protein [Pseudomonadota bacterium]MCG2829977.1 hypothetical protein [Desulfobacteraceae bacterium]